MRGKGNIGEWPWLVRHGDHDAFYLRSFLIGDFRSGRHPEPCYAITLQGKIPHPERPLTCGTCGAKPLSDELTVVERATGKDDFLTPYRERWPGYEWPKVGTRPGTCWLCNSTGAIPRNRVRMSTIAQSFGVGADNPEATVGLCDGCAGHAARVAARGGG